jgi:hypothetical protein
MSRTIEAIIKHPDTTSDKNSAGATPQTMKAIRIHRYGGPQALQYEDAPRPQPQADEVLIRVHAAGVNPIDWKIREGHMKDFWPHKLPLILGWDLSGVVEELGSGVSRFKRNQLATVCAPFAVSFLSVSPPSMHGSPPAGFARVLEKLLPWATMACPAAKSIATRRARKQAGTDKIQRAHLLEPSDVHSRRLLKRQCPTPQEAGLWRCGQAR